MGKYCYRGNDYSMIGCFSTAAGLVYLLRKLFVEWLLR